LLSQATARTSTPRSIRFRHGKAFDGNSFAGTTTLSPVCHGNDSATIDTPEVVFDTNASSSASQFNNLAADPRTCSTRIRDADQFASPFTAIPFAQSANARDAGRLNGEIGPQLGDRHLLSELVPTVNHV
jgi:hypothetical protein